MAKLPRCKLETTQTRSSHSWIRTHCSPPLYPRHSRLRACYRGAVCRDQGCTDMAATSQKQKTEEDKEGDQKQKKKKKKNRKEEETKEGKNKKDRQRDRIKGRTK